MMVIRGRVGRRAKISMTGCNTERGVGKARVRYKILDVHEVAPRPFQRSASVSLAQEQVLRYKRHTIIQDSGKYDVER